MMCATSCYILCTPYCVIYFAIVVSLTMMMNHRFYFRGYMGT